MRSKKILDSKSTPEARAERLRRLRNLASLSRIALCEGNFDLNLNTLKGWEIGKFGGLTPGGAANVVARLALAGVACSTDWLLYELGPAPQVNFSSETENIVGTADMAVLGDKHKQYLTEELMLFRNHYAKSLDYIVLDDSMRPVFGAGDVVAGIKLKDFEDGVGKVCIVLLSDGLSVLRTVCKGQIPGAYTLLATHMESSADHLVLSDIKPKSMAPVLWHRKSID